MERGLDATLPEWDWHEVHSRVVAAHPKRALEALASTPIAAGRAARVLLSIRGLATDGTIVDGLERIGFGERRRSPTEIVLGACGAPWRLHAEMRDLGLPRRHTVLVACDFRAEALDDGLTRLSTETRIKAVDDHARRRFRAYWFLVGPCSALIRRAWLANAATRLGGS